MNIIINESQNESHDRLVLEAIMRGEATSQLHFGIDDQKGEFRVYVYTYEGDLFASDCRDCRARLGLQSEERLQVAELIHRDIVFGWGEYQLCPLKEALRINVVFLDSSKSEFVPDLFYGFGRVAITQRLGRRAL